MDEPTTDDDEKKNAQQHTFLMFLLNRHRIIHFEGEIAFEISTSKMKKIITGLKSKRKKH